jgi:hypothetical protein
LPLKSKHRLLLDQDPEVKRWYDNLARGSIITADERLRRLGRICNLLGKKPIDLIQEKKKSPQKFDNFVLDLVSSYLKQGFKPTYVRNNLITLKSWLAHFGLKIDKKIKLPTEDYKEETIPTLEQLSTLLHHCDLRTRVAAVLMAHSGLRPEAIGSYDGSDGLKLSDLPELKLDPEKKTAEFTKVPTMLIVRRTLSKGRHQYFTFLSAEGCEYLREYLVWRMNDEKEVLSANSPVIRNFLAYERKHEFLRTVKLGNTIRRAMRSAGFTWRPYVLRSFFDTQLMLAESKGKILRDYRVFFMGHKGDIEHRYSLNRGKLPQNIVEDLRNAYSRASEFLETSRKTKTTEEEIKIQVRKALLLDAGFNEEEISKMNLSEMTSEEMQNAVKSKLFGLLNHNGSKQKIVSAPELDSALQQGYEFVSVLPDSRIVVRLPF